MGLYSMISPHIGSMLAVAGLSKLNPTMQKFIGYGAAAGYGTDEILDFLRSKMESQGYGALKGKLQEGEASGTLRPDERATKERMRQTEMAPDIAQAALSTGAGLAGGLLGKGFSKISGSQQNPSSQQSANPQTPIAPQAQGTPQQQQSQPRQPSPEDFLEQYSPELAKAVHMRVQQGSLPKDVAFRLKNKPGTLKNAINLLEQDTKRDFEDVIGQIYGQEETMKQRFGDRKQMMQQAQGKDTFMQLMQKANQQLDQLMGPNG